MYSVTWIVYGKLHSISSPSRATAEEVFHNTRVSGYPARLWFAARKGCPEMVF
jgi:hypothetical protein